MKFAERRIQDNDKALPTKRSQERLKWAKEIEETVRDLAPFPITYDVDAKQDINFSEFAYTEFMNGLYLKTQNIEINARVMDFAYKEPAEKDLVKELESIEDKYVQVIPDIDMKMPEHVVFFVGHNMFDMVDRDKVARAAYENDGNFAIKLHPLTNDEYAGKLAKVVGWNHILPQQVSADWVLRNGKIIYITSATEMATKAVIHDKEIVNVSAFGAEASGCYYALNRVYFEAEKYGITKREALNNMLNCKYSGLILPFMDDVEERIKAFYDKSLELREIYKPISLKLTRNVKQ